MSGSTPGPGTIERAMSAALQLRQALISEDGTLADDDRLLVDVIEGETDVFSVLDRIIENSMADAVLAELADARAKRLKARKDRLRSVALEMLLALEIKRPLDRPAYTASISHRRNVQITSEADLPEAFIRRSPDKVLLNKALRAGEDISGAVLSNQEPHITVRTR